MNKTLVIIGLVLAIGGVIFSLLPHDVHGMVVGSGDHMEGEIGMDEGMDHSSHGRFVTWGLVVAVIGIATAVAGWKIFD